MLKIDLKTLPAFSQSDRNEWLKLVKNLELHNSLLSSLLADIWIKAMKRRNTANGSPRSHGTSAGDGLSTNQLQDLVLLAKCMTWARP